MGLNYTVLGNIVSFRTPSRVPIESLKLHFLPKQEGSGDPSPQNIRDIVGWTGCNLFGSGMNLWDEEWELGSFNNDNGTKSPSSNCIRSKNYIPCKPSTTYYLRHPIQNNDCHLYFYGKNKEFLDHIWKWPGSFTTPSDCYYIRFYMHSSYGTTYLNNIGINYPSKSSYVASAGNKDIPLSWSDHGVVYGGYIDPVKGKLVATWEVISKPLSQWTHAAPTSIRYYTDFAHDMKCVDDGVYGNSQKCNIAPFSWSDVENTNPHFFVGRSSSKGRAYLYLPADYDGSQVIQVAAKLITPIEYDIDPISLQTFLDYNNFQSDTNDITEVTYAVIESKDILKTRRKIINNAPHTETAIIAPIAHFNTDMPAQINELKIHFLPKQFGFDNPSPVNICPIIGWNNITIKTSGKNMLKCSPYGINGTAGDITYMRHLNEEGIVDYVTAVGSNNKTNLFRNLNNSSPTTVPRGILSFNSYSNQANILPIRQDGIPSTINNSVRFIAQDGGSIGASRTGWFDWDTNRFDEYNSWVRIQIWPNGGPSDIDTIIYPMMCHPDDRGCNFESYHGTDYIIKFPAIKNLLDPTTNPIWNNGNYTINSDGSVTVAGSDGRGWTSNQIAPFILPKGTYTFSWTGSQRIQFTTSDDGYETVTTYNYSTSNGHFTFTLANDGGIKWKHTGDAALYPVTCFVQIEKGSSATAFELYGTVYGGYIDLVRSKLIAEYTTKTFNGTEANWSVSGDDWNTDSTGFCVPVSDFSHLTFWNEYIKSNMLKKGNNYALSKGDFYISNQSWANFRIRMTESMTLQEFKAFLAENNIVVVYPLATPIEYDLTPQQIKTLKGTNNIWSDANGDIEVKYWTH